MCGPLAGHRAMNAPSPGDKSPCQKRRQVGALHKAHSSVAEVLKLQCDGEVVRAHGGDDGLEVVPVPAADADFVGLNLRRDFQVQSPDERGNFLGDEWLDALLDLDDLAGVAEG